MGAAAMIEAHPRIKAIVARTLRVPEHELVAQDILRREDTDSLDLIGIVIEAEAEFGVSIDDAEVDALNTVGDLAALVDRKRAGVT
jgi:acyl carrier protein